MITLHTSSFFSINSARHPLKIASLLIAAVFALILTGCSDQGPGGDPGAGGPVTIGIKFDQPGVGERVGENYQGFDVEVARYLANELGYSEVRFIEAPSQGREDLIANNQAKMIIASYSITDARRQQVSFAGPYFVAGQDILVRADNTDIVGPGSLNDKTLCSVKGSTSAENVKQNYSSRVELKDFDSYSACVAALNAGTIDAVSTDDVILAGYAAQADYQGKLKVVGKPFGDEQYGIGIRKGDVDLCTKINTALDKMVADGSWQRALDETVGSSGFKPDATKNPPQPQPCS